MDTKLMSLKFEVGYLMAKKRFFCFIKSRRDLKSIIQGWGFLLKVDQKRSCGLVFQLLQDWCPTLLKQTKSYTWKHAHKSRKFTYKPKFINTQNTSMFFMCVLESQNMKNEIPKPHHGNKSPQTQKTSFTLHWVPITNNKLHETNVLQQIPYNYCVLQG
jgi:hypothetical protein